MKFLRLLFTFALTFLLIYVLDNRFEDVPFLRDVKSLQKIPAIGKFLNPFGGFWVNAEAKKISAELNVKLPQLKDKVEVLFDDRLVPHIFAKNEYDLYFTQGYITAKYRLWQMEFITYAAAGRLSEILGELTFEFDKRQRRMGMVYAAENALKAMEKDEIAKNTIEAYSAGVNAYIASLAHKDYPIEYKLLGYAPEKWTPLKCALLLKYMAYDLSGMKVCDDYKLSNILNKYDKKIVDELFPRYSRRQDPIIPGDTKWDFKKLEIPKKPKEFAAPLNSGNLENKKEPEKGIGSNNWAISAEKSASGYPILANDPHLSLNLPSIWFEVQLITPELNVYGVSLPGAPGVTIGFNEKISWGVTNVESDVLDWYHIQFKDNSLKEYKHGDSLKPVKIRVEEIKIKGKATIKDTLLLTHHGVVFAKPGEKEFADRNEAPVGAAMRWIAHDESAELTCFYKLNRAKNYDDYREALTFYSCPAQNFVFADANKDIAITPNGKFPLKWKEQGKFILDGSNPQHDWQGWIPYNQNPHVKNPPRGFVSSANQFSADTLYPYYLHFEFAPYERGKRINDRLRAMQQATTDSMRALQNDNLYLRAKDLFPFMLPLLQKIDLKGNYQKSFAEISKWNCFYDADKIAPSIFNLWWRYLTIETWNDDLGDANMRFPGGDRTGEFIQWNDSLKPRWFDNVNTPETETLETVVQKSFKLAIDSLVKKNGNFSEKWAWGVQKATSIQHLAQIPAFGVYNLSTNGGANIVNATSVKNGPSWRMVVALGKIPKGYGIYPGGQSGNPGSHYYSNFIETWRKGELAELIYMRKATETNKRLIRKMKLSK